MNESTKPNQLLNDYQKALMPKKTAGLLHTREKYNDEPDKSARQSRSIVTCYNL